MDLPTPLPLELAIYRSAQSEEILLSKLVENPQDFLHFFEAACEDETWAKAHLEVMTKMIGWLTVQIFHDQLSFELGLRAAEAVRHHFSLFKESLNEDIRLKFKEGSLAINSLLLAASSPVFKHRLQKECLERSQFQLSFSEITEQEFLPFKHFIYTGDFPDLWKKSLNELLYLIQQATLWRMSALISLCEERIAKYLTETNALDLLIRAEKAQWPYLRQDCLDFINSRQTGFRLFTATSERLGCEFFDFSEETLTKVQQLYPFLTDLAFKESLLQQKLFIEILKSCPRLFLLDLSGTKEKTPHLTSLPSTLLGLNLSQCAWLTPEVFKQLAMTCPNLIQLMLSSNPHLHFTVWNELGRFKQLRVLDLSRSSQFNSDDLILLSKACGKELIEFSISSCPKVEDRGFFELAKRASRLTHLNLAHSNLSDAALAEIALHCPLLVVLNVSYCPYVTQKGVLAALKQLPALKSLNLVHSKLPPSALKRIKELYPYLKLDY